MAVNINELIKDLEERLGTEKRAFTFKDKQKKAITEAVERLPQNEVYFANGVRPHLLDQLEGIKDPKVGENIANEIKGLFGKLPKGVPVQYADAVEPVLQKFFALDKAIESELGVQAEALELIGKAFGEPKDVDALGKAIDAIEDAIPSVRTATAHETNIAAAVRKIIGNPANGSKKASGLYAKLSEAEGIVEKAGESEAAIRAATRRANRAITDVSTGLKRQVADEGIEALKGVREELFDALKSGEMNKIKSAVGDIQGLEAITEAEVKAFDTTVKALGAESLTVEKLVESGAKATSGKGAFTTGGAGKTAAEAIEADRSLWAKFALRNAEKAPYKSVGEAIKGEGGVLKAVTSGKGLSGTKLGITAGAVAIGASLMMSGRNKDKYQEFDAAAQAR